MKRALPAVAIVGRPNVGKSTLFNRILARRLAIVEDSPGVTRDRNVARADWAGHEFYLIDTGGLEPESKEPMASAVRQQVLAAIAEADLLLLVVDGAAGPHPVDFQIAGVLRKTERPLLLAANKLDRLPDDAARHDFWRLGLGEPFPVSALSGKGTGDLLDELVSLLPEPVTDVRDDTALNLAVIGKPNVGKSSFINRLMGEDRLVVSSEPGTTRDAIDTVLRYHGRNLVLIDTAGLRRQARIGPGLEYYSTLRTERAIERADICLLLLDATEPAHLQDLKIAERAWAAGCGLVIVANKWDLVEKDEQTAIAYKSHLQHRLPWIRWVPVTFTSALTGQRVRPVLELALDVEIERAKRIPTPEVNDAISQLVAHQPPPHHRGIPVRLLYGTQAETLPPTFVIFSNYPKSIPETYVRYIHNGFRARWGFIGSPIRLRFRARKGRS